MSIALRTASVLGRVRSRASGWIGVDIGAGAVKLAQLDRRDDHWHLSKTALVPWSDPRQFEQGQFEQGQLAQEQLAQGQLNPATIANGRLAGMIRQALASCGFFRGRQAACVLSPAACELLTLEVPAAPEPELRDMIGQELAAQHEGAGDGALDVLEFDYWNAHPSVATSEQGFAALNVLGIRRDLAEQTGTEISSAGLDLRELDGTPFTLARALSLAVGESSPSGAVAMLDWGHAAAMLAVIVEGQPIFARTLRDCGCVRLSQAVAAALSLSDNESWHLLSTCGVPSDAGRDSTSQDLQEFVADLLRGPIDEVLTELNKTLAFLKHQEPELAPREVWLCGGGATVKNIAEHLEAGLGVTVRNWRPASAEAAGESGHDGHALPVELFANAAALSLLGAVP
jgi:Tfp pilus assembly PilM family ATPase